MLLHIRCVEAKDVPKMDKMSESDPYLVLKLSSSTQTWKTNYKKDTPSPIWNEDFELPLTTKLDEILTITMYDKDIGKDDIISHCNIQVNKLPFGKVSDGWFKMTPEKGVNTGGQVRLLLHLAKRGDTPFVNS